MSVTYEEARESVRSRLQPEWKWGTFCLDDRQIVENDECWVFEIGAREALVDGDHSYLIAGGVTVVYKDDGRIGSLASMQVALDPSMRTRPNPEPTLIVPELSGRASWRGEIIRKDTHNRIVPHASLTGHQGAAARQPCAADRPPPPALHLQCWVKPRALEAKGPAASRGWPHAVPDLWCD